MNPQRKSTLIQHLDLLAGSLALDEQFRQDFSIDRIKAIQRFNREFATRYNQRPIELTEMEKRLVTSIKAKSVEEFIDLVAVITAA